jgi:hypothetical protein
MAYDMEIAERLRDALSGEAGLSEKRMFGGLAFLINGNMAVSASGRGDVLLRCNPSSSDTLTAATGVERAVMQGREMDGWLRVAPSVIATEEALEQWVGVGLAYAKSLPAK